jgi:hypothetical protein
MPTEILGQYSLSSRSAEEDFHSLSNGLAQRMLGAQHSRLIMQFCMERLARLGDVAVEREDQSLANWLLLTEFY